MRERHTLPLALAGLFLVLAGLTGPLPSAAFERTETREPCAGYEPLRRPFFGDTHVHTALSFDASAAGVRNRPADAYRFAKGERVGIRPYAASGRALRSVQLDHPLDFAVVTDHSELLGEVRICSTPGLPGHDSFVCTLYRRWPLLAYYLVNSAIFNSRNPERYSFCGPDGRRCLEAARGPWSEIQRAAEAAYDRSAACRFTSFVGYEWSPNPDSGMIHRNVIFRNAVVQAVPANYIDEPTETQLWDSLERDCLDLGNGCDVLAIPHNSNLSDGQLFRVETPEGRPIDAAWARRRARLETLVEVIQHKGASECRDEIGAADELCGFERLPFATMDQYPTPFRWSEPARLSYVREVLGEGLRQYRRLGTNPFRLGLIGSTDTHMGTPGLVSERDFPGHAAGGDTSHLEIPRRPDRLFLNPGGLAVLWAEENSRDALFEAMRRREAYATSGPRLVVRFFGGWDYAADLCESERFAAEGYAGGVPMGAELPARPGSSAPSAPRFAVWALADAGGAGEPRPPLERIQIVKLAADAAGVRTRVFEVAGQVDPQAGVDPDTCAPHGRGAMSLCRVWTDPEFDPAEPALYYARVLESPSCRWSRWTCLRERVDCTADDPVPAELAYCCDPDVPHTLRERAWTSPIWVLPQRGKGD